MDYLDRPSRRPSPSRGVLRILFGIALLGGLALVGSQTFRAGDSPEVKLESVPPAIGRQTSFGVVIRESSRGLVRVRLELVQNGQAHPLLDRSCRPQPAYAPWDEMTAQAEFSVTVPKELVASLAETQATIRVVAEGASAWLSKSEPAVVERTLPVRLHPPSIEVLSGHIYPTRGGSEAVVYRVGKTAVRHGVQVGSWFFPGAPLPGRPASEQFAFFGIPHDVELEGAVRLIAEDDVGNAANIPFLDRVKPRPFPKDTIRLSDALLNRIVDKVSASVPEVPKEGSLMDRYLFINRDLRRDNRQRLRAVAKETTPKFLWTQSFLQMPAKAVSSFADQRAYVYRGQVVDRQNHLGFDLASTARAPIPASNAGRVLLAENLGIYGLVVVIDHGFGLMTLYAHLSSSAVTKGDVVQRGQTIGRTGSTGLALGDHLHFTTLVHGLPVNPLEWWDESWVRNRIVAKLGPGLRFEHATTE